MHPGPSGLLQATACWWASRGCCECTVLCRGGRHSRHVCGWPENRRGRHCRGRCRVYVGSKNCSMKEAIKSQQQTMICCYFYRRVCTNTHSYPLVSTSSSSIHVKIWVAKMDDTSNSWMSWVEAMTKQFRFACEPQRGRKRGKGDDCDTNDKGRK